MPKRHWTKQNWIRVVEYSSFEVSDPFEVALGSLANYFFSELTVFPPIGPWKSQKRVKKELQELPWGSRLRTDMVHDI